MRVLIATPATQGDRPDDHCWTTDGELVSLPVLECSCPDCGCDRSFSGLDSHRATTTCAVAETDLDVAGLRAAVVVSLADAGWLVDLDAPAGEPPSVVEDLADLHHVVDPAPADGLSALDRELVDDVVARIGEVAAAFPPGTVLGRAAGGLVLRRPAPAGVAPVTRSDILDPSVRFVAMDADTEARAILERIWSEVTPVAIPVDPVRIAWQMGIDVLEAELEPDVSGALVKRRDQDPRIVLNRRDHPNRQRFSCAHELGHFVQRAGASESFEYVDLRGPSARTGSDPSEVFANAFAANLLMPADEVRRRAKGAASLVELAFEFRVSQEAMANRLTTLGIRLG